MSDTGYLLLGFVVAVVAAIGITIWDALNPTPKPFDGYPHDFFYFP